VLKRARIWEEENILLLTWGDKSWRRELDLTDSEWQALILALWNFRFHYQTLSASSFIS